MTEFIIPQKHIGFKAKKLTAELGEIKDCSIAYIQPNGGGPIELHTHSHNHFFIVTQGEAKILLGEKSVIIKKDESCLVDGNIPHAVWNNVDSETVMIGISIMPQKKDI
jgi:mannose-6-phosphate isomerase-like protein (cupin superfamily)